MALEKLRQREVHKYYQSWLESSAGLDSKAVLQLSRYHQDGSQLRVSKDTALIAFAQLGCLRLDVKRCVITLISTDLQYILAEATKTLSLVSGDGDSEAQDEIWFGNASMPRSQGVSGDSLHASDYTATNDNGTSYTAPALVINDLTLHEKYKSRPYAGKGVTFYCGVPIVTQTGIHIGVYTVTDDKPRDGLRPHELRFMHDMAATVMRHLDVASSEAARFRGETLVVGLGKFISGARSMQDGSSDLTDNTLQEVSQKQVPTKVPSEHGLKGMAVTAANHDTLRSNTKGTPANASDQIQKPMEASSPGPHAPEVLMLNTEQREADEHRHAEPPTIRTTNEHSTEFGGSKTHSRSPHLADDVFSRAAGVLRECIAADGVLFFDAVSTNSAASRRNTGFRAGTSRTMQFSDDRQPDVERKNGATLYQSGLSEESDVGVGIETEKRFCRLLGHDLSPSTHVSGGADFLGNIKLTERSLHRLVKLYPEGKLFTFNHEGEVSASDAEFLTQASSSTSKNKKKARITTSDESRRVPRAIAGELSRLVPNAQSLVWLPLWDFTKQRWSAGLFLWSRGPDRMATAQNDLVYLKAFGNSIMVEVARSDAAIADTAKSTFIANISHELRTPLHGILGNLDLLQDTKLSEFQHSLTNAIEVCGRTLSDTIDHVLDYSKINQLSKHSRRRNQSNSVLVPFLSHNTQSNATPIVEEDFDVASITEEAVEAAYASHTFQSNGRTTQRSASVLGTRAPTIPSSRPHEGPRVSVIIELEHRNSWAVKSQASAIRRVVTNLFGNALKYTESGTIWVFLSSPRLTNISKATTTVPVLLVVKDTGRGMSSDFLRNHAFTPFRQESQFSTGTGLGLSIVQQIVKSLGGKVELQSEQAVGTEVRVFLDLPLPDNARLTSRSTVPLQSQFGARAPNEAAMVIVSPEDRSNQEVLSGHELIMTSIETTARDWYGLRVTRTDTIKDEEMDVVVYITPPAAEALQALFEGLSSISQTRLIILVSNTIEKAALVTKYSNTIPGWIDRIDILSLPIGPRKLGESLSRHSRFSRFKDESTYINTATPWPRIASSLPALTERKSSSMHTPEDMDIDSQSTGDCAKPQHHSISAQPPEQAKTNLSESGQQLMKGSVVEYQSQQRLSRMSGTATKRSASPSWHSPQVRPVMVMPRSISAPSSSSGLPSISSTGQPSLLRVLLVDDNDINLTILKTCMKRAQISFDFAKDGLEASNTFQHAFKTKVPFTHVLMDISMPIMDGIQSTREIREFERQQSSLSRVSSRTNEPDLVATPPPVEATTKEIEHEQLTARTFIIALSGVASEDTQLEMLEAGADMFLPKPVKLKELVRILTT